MPGSAILLLHGALGTKAQFDSLLPALRNQFDVHTLNFEGHGQATGDRPFRIEHFAENVLAYLDAHHIAQTNLFGYSMGGYVGLYLALMQPARVNSLFTLATKLAWTPEVALREISYLDADKILAKVPRYAESLHTQHGEGWREVLTKTADLLTTLGGHNLLTTDVLKQIGCRVRIGVGDRDATVSLEECLSAYHALPNGELQVFPNTLHPFEKVDTDTLAAAMQGFFV